MIGLLLRPHGGNDRETRTKFGGPLGVVEYDFDGDALNNFGEVAGGVIGRQQSELRAARGRYFDDVGLQNLARENIDADFRAITDFHVGELGFAVVGLNPFGLGNEGQNLRAGREELTGANLAFAHDAIGRRVEFGVSEVYLGDGKGGFPSVEIGDQLMVLRFEDGLRAALGFDRDFVGVQRSFGLLQVGFATCGLRGKALFIGNSGLDALLGCGLGCEQSFLAGAFSARAGYVGLNRVDASFGRGNLRFCKIDPGQSPLDFCVLQLALPEIVFKGCLGRFDGCGSLGGLRAIVIVIQFNQQVTRMHFLKVGNVDGADDPWHFRAQGREVTSHICIVGHLFDSPSLPGIPVSRESDHESSSEEDNGNRSDVTEPWPDGPSPDFMMLGVFCRTSWAFCRYTSSSQAALLLLARGSLPPKLEDR